MTKRSSRRDAAALKGLLLVVYFGSVALAFMTGLLLQSGFVLEMVILALVLIACLFIHFGHDRYRYTKCNASSSDRGNYVTHNNKKDADLREVR
jgi:hypothetical protein